MDIVETAIESEAVDGAAKGAVVAQPSDFRRDVFAVGDHGAAVPVGAEVFLNDEARRHRLAQLALPEARAVGVNGLGTVLYHPQPVTARERVYGLHIGALAVKVDRDDSHRPGREGACDFG